MAQGIEHMPTPETRNLVKELSGYGLSQKDICALVKLSDPETLAKHYRAELDEGKARANSAVGKRLFQKVIEGDTTAGIWWSKTQMGWKDQQTIEHTGSLEIKQIQRTIVDPKA